MPPKLVILLSCLICHTYAHESPSHSIELLDQHIEESPTPALLFQRAMAYKALGKMNRAAADLTLALKEQPNQLEWLLEHCHIEFARNRADSALRTANKCLKLAKENNQRADIHILRAQAHQLNGKPKPSLHACQLAFKEVPDGKINWFLLRAENQYLLGLHKERIHGLKAGLKIYPETILKPHYVDALIDVGQYKHALTIIEKELPSLRWQAHWQVKKAQVLIALNRQKEAQVSLQGALQEINQRLNPSQPDILLLADRAHTELLMGKKAESKATLLQLRKHRAPSWLISRIQVQLADK